MRNAAWMVIALFVVFLRLDPAVAASRADNKSVIESVFAENTNKYAGSSDVLVLPGLLADRVEKQVRFFVETTGISSNDPAEFLLIGEQSGHAYEAIAVSLVKPSDVHRALEFIGMKPGHPACPEKLCFWPKGERVTITFRWHAPAPQAATPAAASVQGATGAVAAASGAGTNAAAKEAEPAVELRQARAEMLMINRETGRLFAPDGYVFTGSAAITNAADPAGNGYAADIREPHSIASHYNDMETVLDVPRRAPQHQVYLSQYPNPEYIFPTGVLVAVVLQPEYATGKQRVADLLLKVAVSNSAASGSNELVYSLSETGGDILADKEPFSKLPALFEKYIAGGRDPFATVDFDGQLSLREAAMAANMLAAVDSEAGIRIEPPPPGQFYYRAFVPPPQFRERATRPVQPWEYHVSVSNGTTVGTLILAQEVREETGSGWIFKDRTFDVPTPDALKAALATKNERGMPIGPAAICVYAPSSVKYADLRQLLAPVLDTCPTIYVFSE